MPLVNLQTNLKSLKFGEGTSYDRPNSGFSNQPYNKSKIPGRTAPTRLDRWITTDQLVRGGVVNAAVTSFEDTVRLGKMFLDLKSPRGILFTLNQNILSRIATRTQASGKFFNDGVYTPLTTLGQSLTGFAGVHLQKQGLIPGVGVKSYGPKSVYNHLGRGLTFNPQRGKYDIIGDETGKGNRLSQLAGIYIDNSIEWKKKDHKKELLIAEPKTNFSPNILKYPGGPRSILGIGQTGIRFATDNKSNVPLRTGANNSQTIKYINKRNVTIGTIQPNKFQRIDENSDLRFIELPLGASIAAVNFKDFPGFNTTSTSDNRFHIIDEGGIEIFPSVYKPEDPNSSTFKLEVRPDIKTYQVGNKINRTKNFISPLNVSKEYTKRIGGDFLEVDEFGNEFAVTPNGKEFVSITNANNLVWKNQDESSIYQTKSFDNTRRVFDNGTYVFRHTDIIEFSQDNNLYKLSKDGQPTIVDFRKRLHEQHGFKKSSILGVAPDYNPTKNKTIDGPTTSRINYTNPGQKGNRIDYTKGKLDNTGEKIGPVDRINALPIYKSSDGGLGAAGLAPKQNDLVKFRIGAIRNSSPSEKDYVNFRAFIDSFSDQYNASWSPQQYMGRGEKFYKYDSFERSINMSFTVAAQSVEEIMIMYKKLNFLTSNLAPDYTNAGYMAGPLVQLTLGGWCYELPGFISAITLDVPQESPWEIGIPNVGRGTTSAGGITYRNPEVKEMPMICKVTGLTFTPIHNFRPAKQTLNSGAGGMSPKKAVGLDDENSYGNQRYIALANGKGRSFNNYDS